MFVPVVMTALYVLAMLSGLSDPFAVMLVGLFTMSAIVALVTFHGGLRNHLRRDVLAIAWLGALGCSYLLVVSWMSPIGSAWWKAVDRAAFCLLLITVACMQGDVHRAIRFLGLSTMLWFLVGMAVLAVAPTDVSYDMAIVGAGNINWMMNPAALVAVFWFCSVWNPSSMTRGRLDRIFSLVLLAAVVSASLALGRRGSLIGIMAGSVCALLVAAPRRFYWVIAVIASIVLAAAGAISVARWGGISNYLNEPHVYMLASAGQVAVTALPWGDGGFASITHVSNAAEACRHLTASGQRMLQSHNEVLDLIADGGVVLLLLVAAGAVILVRRWRRLEDAAVKCAIAGAGGAVVTVAMVDNVFSHLGGAVFVALVVGLLLKAEAREDREVGLSWAYLPLALLLTMTLAAIGGMFSIAIRRGGDASLAGDLAIANRTWNPMVLDVFLGGMLRRAGEAKDAAAQTRCVELLRTRLGPSIGLVTIAARLARARGDGEAELRHLQEGLRLQPFSLATYARLSELLQDNPELVVRCEPRVVGRIRSMMPGPSLAGRTDHLDAGIESAADGFALVVGQAANHQAWDVVLLARIAGTYGDVPDVAIAALGCLVAAPAGSGDAFSSSAGQLLRGLRSVNVVRILAAVQGTQDARRSIEGLRRLGLQRLGKDVAAELARIEALAAGEFTASG